MNKKPNALYRYFDAKDILLYVGISGTLAIRDKSHIAASRWMQLTARSTVEHRETAEDAARAEREAIKSEHPLFNQRDNNTPEAKERLRAYLEGIGRMDLLAPPERRSKSPQEELPEAQLWLHENLVAAGFVKGLLGWSRHVKDIPLVERGMGPSFLLDFSVPDDAAD